MDVGFRLAKFWERGRGMRLDVPRLDFGTEQTVLMNCATRGFSPTPVWILGPDIFIVFRVLAICLWGGFHPKHSNFKFALLVE